jgi:hypothetical protein
MGPCHDMTRPRVADGGYGIHMWRLAANILINQSRQPTVGGLPASGLGEGVTTPHCKTYPVARCYTGLG